MRSTTLFSSNLSAFKPFNRTVSSASNSINYNEVLRRNEKSIRGVMPLNSDSTDNSTSLIKTKRSASNCSIYLPAKKDKKEVKRRANSLESIQLPNSQAKTIESNIQNILFIGKMKKFNANLELMYRNMKEKKLSNQLNNQKSYLASSRGSVSSSLSRLFSQLNQNFHFPCSHSLIDLVILIFRFKDTSFDLINFIIPTAFEKNNVKFLEAKSQNIFFIYKV